MTTIGISIFPPKTGFSFWSNGAHQNVMFLWLLLRSIPGVGRCLLINGGDGNAPRPEDLPPALRQAEFVRAGDVVDQLDVVIEAGAQLEVDHVTRVRSRGGRAIALKFGNSLAIDAEHAIHGKAHSTGIFNGARFDEVWTTAQHAETCGSYWETCYRAPVRVLPHVWEPIFVDHMIAAFPPGLRAGYQPGRARKRVAVMEPNINLIKTAHVPMLICERAYRERPDLFESVMVTNAIQMRGRISFEAFVGALDIAKPRSDAPPVMSFEGRYNTPWFLSAHADVIVSHQWISNATYLHYDALALGFPLVHNAGDIPGYRYRGFDAGEGAAALLRAMTEHDAREQNYREEARGFLAHRRATAPRNIEAHARALAEVMGR